MRPKELLSRKEFSLPGSRQKIVFSQAALQTFIAYKQTDKRAEAGGLLFAQFNSPDILVINASRPHWRDQRSRFLFVPDRTFQRALIIREFRKGNHFVGEWHTHPEPEPSPSWLDLGSMAECFTQSRHELNWFLMVIVGNSDSDLNLWVSAHNNDGYLRLK